MIDWPRSKSVSRANPRANYTRHWHPPWALSMIKAARPVRRQKVGAV